MLAGVTQTEIALSLKITTASVNDVITGRRKTPRIQQAISLAIGKQISEIWPENSTDEEVIPERRSQQDRRSPQKNSPTEE